MNNDLIPHGSVQIKCSQLSFKTH